jgi:hypothetical protein
VQEIGDCNQMGAQCLPYLSDGSRPFNRLAGEGRYFNGVGGARVFVARMPEDSANAGRWAVHWVHRERDLQGTDATPTLLPEECDEILAVDALRLQDGESVVLVCRDRILRYFGPNERQNSEWRFDGAELGRIQPVEWATIRRRLVDSRHDSAFDVLVGFRSSLGNMRLRLYDFVAGSVDAPLASEYPDILNLGSDADLESPIHLSVHPSGPPVRVHNGQAQALFSERDDAGNAVLNWQDVVTAKNSDSASYSVMPHLLFTSREAIDPDTNATNRAYWAVDTVGDRGQYNLWATSAVHQGESDVVHWGSMQAAYTRPLFQIRSTNEAGTEFKFGAIELSCRSF